MPSALTCYEERPGTLRKNTGARSPLFISVCKPHKPVKAATLGHWLNSMMKSAGIDTSAIITHSTRGAVTSKAKVHRASIADILKAANWSSQSTFCRFYDRPISSEEFGRALLHTEDKLQTIPYSKLTMLSPCILHLLIQFILLIRLLQSLRNLKLKHPVLVSITRWCWCYVITLACMQCVFLTATAKSVLERTQCSFERSHFTQINIGGTSIC